MNGKFLGRWFRFAFVLPGLTLLAGTTVEAALLGISSAQPDVGFSSNVSYAAPTCAKLESGGSAPAAGICGTKLDVGGTNNDGTYNGALQVAGTLTITDLNTIMLYSDWAAGGTDVLADFNGDFTLMAYFNADGVFGATVDDVAAGIKTSNLTLTYANLDAGGSNPAVTGLLSTSGTIITANLGAFGYAGFGNGGAFDFAAGGLLYGGSVTGGDWSTLGYNYSGTIAGTTLSIGQPSSGVSWELDGNGDTDVDLFKRAFSGTASVDTFVPVPAAMWLFGSGLALLAGMARRRRSAQH